MDMRITNVAPAYPVNGVKGTQVAKRLSRKEESADAFSISSEAKDTQFAIKNIKSGSNIRSGKVADIKARMEAGTYSVSSTDIANKMVNKFNAFI